jgi:hypothetical protein
VTRSRRAVQFIQSGQLGRQLLARENGNRRHDLLGIDNGTRSLAVSDPSNPAHQSGLPRFCVTSDANTGPAALPQEVRTYVRTFAMCSSLKDG